MYQRLYDEVVNDSYSVARQREKELLEKGVKLLSMARIRGAKTVESFEATHFMRSLWSTLVLDLGNDENRLPVALRASLISIGIWILRELDKIDSGESANFDGLIEINRTIADGLQ
ncbi:MAG: flagellar biosynthesis regulator FlaF [Methylocystis sp.]|jgi:flagellar protein FlaF